MQSPMPFAGLPQEVTVRPPHRFNEFATKSEKWNGKPRMECVDGRHQPSKTCGYIYCPGHAGVKGNDRADRLAGKATLTTRSCVEKLEALPAGAKPRT